MRRELEATSTTPLRASTIDITDVTWKGSLMSVILGTESVNHMRRLDIGTGKLTQVEDACDLNWWEIVVLPEFGCHPNVCRPGESIFRLMTRTTLHSCSRSNHGVKALRYGTMHEQSGGGVTASGGWRELRWGACLNISEVDEIVC